MRTTRDIGAALRQGAQKHKPNDGVDTDDTPAQAPQVGRGVGMKGNRSISTKQSAITNRQ